MSGRPAQSQAGTPVWTSSPGSLESRGPLETGEEILGPGEGGLCCLCWTCQNTNNSQAVCHNLCGTGTAHYRNKSCAKFTSRIIYVRRHFKTCQFLLRVFYPDNPANLRPIKYCPAGTRDEGQERVHDGEPADGGGPQEDGGEQAADGGGSLRDLLLL